MFRESKKNLFKCQNTKSLKRLFENLLGSKYLGTPEKNQTSVYKKIISSFLMIAIQTNIKHLQLSSKDFPDADCYVVVDSPEYYQENYLKLLWKILLLKTHNNQINQQSS